MSMFIKGMEIPKNCSTCPCFQYNMFDDDIDGYCKALKTKITDSDKYHPNCPLTEIPTPHGRLIDADALWDRMYKYSDNEGAKMPFGDNDFMIHKDSACELIEDAPTIIEAEE